jgi:hypothetical protein
MTAESALLRYLVRLGRLRGVALPAMAMVVYNCSVPDESDDVVLGFTPNWPTCAHDAGRCTGRRIEGFEHCLAHLTAADLDIVLLRFTPGADLDLRGTPLTAGLLQRLLASMSEDPVHASPRLGHADFSYCHFSVDEAQHTGDVSSVDHLVR